MKNGRTELRPRKWLARLRGGLIAAMALSLGASGCVRTDEAESELVYGYPTVSVETVPPDIYVYPRVYYHGYYAYLVGDQWYYHSPRGWVIFRSPPREIEARRAHVVREHRRRQPPRVYYEERVVPAHPREPVERGRRYFPD